MRLGKESTEHEKLIYKITRKQEEAGGFTDFKSVYLNFMAKNKIPINAQVWVKSDLRVMVLHDECVLLARRLKVLSPDFSELIPFLQEMGISQSEV